MKILFIQLKRIGDLILTVPAIAAARHHFPAAEISLIVRHDSRELLPAIPGVDRTFVARGRASDVLLWGRIGMSKFDYCLDFSRTDRSAFLTLLSGAKNRITYDTARRERMRQLGYNQFIPSPVRSAHTIDYHLALLAPLGVHDASSEIHLGLPDAARERADEIIASQRLGESFVIFHPGSARPEKFWEASRWAEVINAFDKESAPNFIMTGSPSAMEQTHLAQIKSLLHRPIIDLSGQINLLTLAALLQRARLLVTIDSAPMHLAAALGTPQVVLFGPTNPFHWRPRSTPAAILQGDNPEPLSDFTPRQMPVAMKDISTARVIDAMQSLLSAPPAPLS